jgi:Ca2+-dependent lipid-binding protein
VTALTPLEAAIGVLQVSIYSATGLRNPDKFSGTPDPYVVLSINSGRELARTETQPSTTTPRWNEHKTLLINSLNDSLSFQVFDFNEIRKDRLLGTANFDLKSLEENPEQEGVTTTIMYNAKARGDVLCDVRFYPVLKPTKREDGTEAPPPETSTGIVAFTVHQAKDLDARKSLVGALSPYAVFLLNGKEIQVSKKAKRTNNPVWDEHVEILVQNRMNCRLGVVIKDDRELATDVVVGSYQIRLNDFLERMEYQQDWFTLAGTPTGKVRMEVNWKPVFMPGGLQGSGGYVTPIGVMRFHLQKATDVRNVEAVTGGKSDPYVRVMVSNCQMARTIHINNDLNPVWDEVLYVPVHHVKEKYVLEVMDHQGHTKDRSLGYTQVDANEFVRQNEEGEYLESSARIMRVEPLGSDRGENKGFVHYTVSFYPCLNIADPEEEGAAEKAEKEVEEVPDATPKNGLDRTHEKAPETPEKSIGQIPDNSSKVSLEASRSKSAASTPAPANITGKDPEKPGHLSAPEKGHHPSQSVTSLAEKKEPPKVVLTPQQLLSYQSGILVFKIIDGDLARKDCYLEILFDDYAFPSYVSSKARSHHQKWDEIGDGFVRELEFSRITMRLREKSDAKPQDLGDVIATLTGDTLDVLKISLNDPHEYALKSITGELFKIKVSTKYIPVEMNLDASESINNMGDLKVDLIEAKNVPAADRSGYSDPYCVFVLNDEKVFKSKVVKKTLNPIFDEKFDVSIPSRTGANFVIEVWDWDFGGADDYLGKADIDLAGLEPFQMKSVTLPLDGKSGELKLRLVFRPAYITRTRRGTSTFTTGATRAFTGLAGGLTGGLTTGKSKHVGKGVGMAAGQIGGAANFVKRGLGVGGRRKTTISEEDEQEITPGDLDIAKAAIATGTEIKGSSDGLQLAVTGDNKLIPLNVDPDQLSSNGKHSSRVSSAHARDASIMSNRTGTSESGLLQISVMEGRGFPSGKEIRIILKIGLKEFYKSKAIKATEPVW